LASEGRLNTHLLDRAVMSIGAPAVRSGVRPTKSSMHGTEMDKRLSEYRTSLVSVEQKAQEEFDKTILALSGGGLGISFAFVKDIVGPQPLAHSWLLLASWTMWALSVASVLFSFFTSNLALRKAIKQVDTDTIYEERVGGGFDTITIILNGLGGVLFFTGLILQVIFVGFNLR